MKKLLMAGPIGLGMGLALALSATALPVSAATQLVIVGLGAAVPEAKVAAVAGLAVKAFVHGRR